MCGLLLGYYPNLFSTHFKNIFKPYQSPKNPFFFSPFFLTKSEKGGSFKKLLDVQCSDRAQSLTGGVHKECSMRLLQLWASLA